MPKPSFASPARRVGTWILLIVAMLAGSGPFQPPARAAGGAQRPPWAPAAPANATTPPEAIADRALGQVIFNFATPAAGAAGLKEPAGVAIAPSGRIFVVDYGNNRVLSWPNARAARTGAAADLVLGQPSFAATAAGSGLSQMNGPEAVAVDSAGRVYVADSANHRVLIFAGALSSGMAASQSFGAFVASLPSPPPLQNSFNYPRGMALDSRDNLYLVDEFHNRVLVYLAPATTNLTPDAQFLNLASPRGVAVDPADNVYIADSENDRVLGYAKPVATANYAADRTFGGSDGSHLNCLGAVTINDNPSQGSMSCPIDVAVDPAGRLYVADIFNHRVLMYDNPATGDNQPDAVFGQPGYASSQPNLGGGPATNTLNNPLGMDFDSDGGLYVADLNNHRVLIFDAPPASPYAHNLIANGDAEATAGTPNSTAFAPGSWEIINGELDAMKYGAEGNFPGPGSPGPAQRGANFFGGGNQPTTIGGQTFSLAQIAGAVDAGKVTYHVSGYFGGFLAEGDTAYLEVNFQDADRIFIDQVLVGGPTPLDRQNLTGLFFASKQGTLPASTRFLQIRVHMDRVSGATNDGYADNLSLVLLGPGTQAYMPRVIR
jgi:sugar lactone lactonase YvrE